MLCYMRFSIYVSYAIMWEHAVLVEIFFQDMILH